MSEETCLCIHGHFYQPPRENPWVEDIEYQSSAGPYHDWNERIFRECYLPNSQARVLDAKGRLVDIVNNYEKISFNFGPTLMVWLKAKHPTTYGRILAADRSSGKAHKGHGNAIAQVYNHMIMPLANHRDKVTQVRWGVADFRDRFQRDPEGLWLPETAVNEETLEVVVEEEVKFIILEPQQAGAVRPLEGGEWKDVSGGAIDPKVPYRCFLKKDLSRFIDIFFYDGPISKAVGFENILSDARHFMRKIAGARVEGLDDPQLIHIATDGETYGHHKAYGDRVLAYLLNVEAQEKGYRVVNYGEFLEAHPPRQAVRLKEGENDEGTSWSCPHGVKRWKDHCGCRGGGPGEWTQAWRKPLRETLDGLRDALAKVYEEKAAQYLKDPWHARDRYIEVVLHRNDRKIEEFFKAEAHRDLREEEVVTSLKLLEIQRHAMLMYTSCGWFFPEISGIETVQVLQYAARAIQLAKECAGLDLEPEFLNQLSRAKSNLSHFKDGRGVYEKLVRPAVATLRHVAAFYAIGSLFENYFQEEDEKIVVHSLDITVGHHRKESFGNITLGYGRVKIFSRVTREKEDLIFVVTQIGLYDFRCSIKPFTDPETFEDLENELFDGLRDLHVVELSRKIDERFGEAYYSLKDLLLEDRMRIMDLLMRDTIESARKVYDRLYDEHRRIHEVYRSSNLPIPEEFRYSAEQALQHRIMEALLQLPGHGFSLQKAKSLYKMFDDARVLGVNVQSPALVRFLSNELFQRVKRFCEILDMEPLQESLNILKIAKRTGLELRLRLSQDELFALLKKWRDHPPVPSGVDGLKDALLELVVELHFDPDTFRKIIKARSEEPVAEAG